MPGFRRSRSRSISEDSNRLSPPSASRWDSSPRFALASLTVLAAFGWIELEVPLEIERAIAEVLVLAAIVVALRVATARPPTPARPLHALL